MTVTYSIQGSDLSTREEGEVKSAAQLVGTFEAYDWNAELVQQAQREASGKDNCPAGLSIVREPYVFMHICPNNQDTVMMHCIHTSPSKILGIFKSQNTTNLHVASLQKNIAIQAISKFLAADNDWLLANIKED